MNKINLRISVIAVLILVAAVSRLVPHPYNFSPLVAIALFGGFHFNNKLIAVIMPLAAYFISDLIFAAMGSTGFYGITQLFVYGAMILVTFLGASMKNAKPARLLGYSISGSAIFWIISNFGVWVANYFAQGSATHETGLTLAMTYVRALPFYNTYSNELFFGAFLGDTVYTAILFGAFGLVQKKFPVLHKA